MKTLPKEKICPFCKGHNRCMAGTDTPCWCNDIEVPTALIDLVPPELKRKACICQNCVTSFNASPEIFIQNINT